MSTEENRDRLIASAAAVRANAYAPYSGYLVGAAVMDDQGQIHPGVNVENIAYGSTICAERNAILRMVAEGGREIKGVAVITQDGGSPCGACLQVINEFANRDTPIWLSDSNDNVKAMKLGDFLPLGFTSPEVKRTL